MALLKKKIICLQKLPKTHLSACLRCQNPKKKKKKKKNSGSLWLQREYQI